MEGGCCISNSPSSIDGDSAHIFYGQNPPFPISIKREFYDKSTDEIAAAGKKCPGCSRALEEESRPHPAYRPHRICESRAFVRPGGNPPAGPASGDPDGEPGKHPGPAPGTGLFLSGSGHAGTVSGQPDPRPGGYPERTDHGGAGSGPGNDRPERTGDHLCHRRSRHPETAGPGIPGPGKPETGSGPGNRPGPGGGKAGESRL